MGTVRLAVHGGSDMCACACVALEPDGRRNSNQPPRSVVLLRRNTSSTLTVGSNAGAGGGAVAEADTVGAVDAEPVIPFRAARAALAAAGVTVGATNELDEPAADGLDGARRGGAGAVVAAAPAGPGVLDVLGGAGEGVAVGGVIAGGGGVAAGRGSALFAATVACGSARELGTCAVEPMRGDPGADGGGDSTPTSAGLTSPPEPE